MDELSTDGSLSLEGRLEPVSRRISRRPWARATSWARAIRGVMVGYATDETPERMAAACGCWHKSSAGGLDESRIPWLKPDGKAQVTVLYQD